MDKNKPDVALIVVEGRDAGKIIPLNRFPFKIGRDPESQLILADEQVSRQHAQIEKTGTGYVLADLKSRNGVTVDGIKIERRDLNAGDRIRLGATILMFHSDVNTAREVMAESIPDAESFALDSPRFEEPTKIHRIPDDSDHSSSPKAIPQLARLVSVQLAPKGASSSVLDILFQSFSPDRAQLIWEVGEKFQVARSRMDGRDAPAFTIPAELFARARNGPLSLRINVPVPSASGVEKRWVMIAPMRGGHTVLGWLYADRTDKQSEFSSNETLEFETFAGVAAGIMERTMILQENKALRTQMVRLEKHLSPEVARMLWARKESIEEGDVGVARREVTILFCDIKNFTPLSERLSPEDLAQLLNEYFQRMVDVINAHHGHLNKFIGDAVMALFGAPESHDNDAVNAVSAALGMIESLAEFRTQVSEIKRFSVRIGINTGDVVAGNIGSDKKMEYTVLGDAVNVASRLEGISLPDRITIGPITAEKVKDFFELEKLQPVQVKGKAEAIQIFRVVKKI